MIDLVSDLIGSCDGKLVEASGADGYILGRMIHTADRRGEPGLTPTGGQRKAQTLKILMVGAVRHCGAGGIKDPAARAGTAWPTYQTLDQACRER